MVAWQLILQGTTAKTDETLAYLIEGDEQVARKVEKDLAAAKPGEFVAVPSRFANLIQQHTVYVQPHAWGVWTVIPQVVPVEALWGAR